MLGLNQDPRGKRILYNDAANEGRKRKAGLPSTRAERVKLDRKIWRFGLSCREMGA